MSLTGQLNLRATVERAATSVSSTGAASLTWSVVASSVPCSLSDQGASVRQSGPGLRLETTHVAHFGWGTDVRPQSQGGPGDRVTIDGVAYIVLHVVNVSGRGRMLRAEMKRER